MVKVKVRLFHELRANVGQSDIELEANTLDDIIQNLMRKYSALKELLFDSNGNLHHNILFYINNMVQNPPDLSRKLNDGDLVLLVPPAAGG